MSLSQLFLKTFGTPAKTQGEPEAKATLGPRAGYEKLHQFLTSPGPAPKK